MQRMQWTKLDLWIASCDVCESPARNPQELICQSDLSHELDWLCDLTVWQYYTVMGLQSDCPFLNHHPDTFSGRAALLAGNCCGGWTTRQIPASPDGRQPLKSRSAGSRPQRSKPILSSHPLPTLPAPYPTLRVPIPCPDWWAMLRRPPGEGPTRKRLRRKLPQVRIR